MAGNGKVFLHNAELILILLCTFQPVYYMPAGSVGNVTGTLKYVYPQYQMAPVQAAPAGMQAPAGVQPAGIQQVQGIPAVAGAVPAAPIPPTAHHPTIDQGPALPPGILQSMLYLV